MATDLVLPDLGENIEMGIVVKVLVEVGDTIEEGQPVIELETDKAVVEVPADKGGEVTALHVKEGDEIRVGAKILSLKTPSADEEAGQRQAEATDRSADAEGREGAGRKERASKGEDAGKNDEATASGEQNGEQEERTPEEAEEPRKSKEPAPAAPSVRRFAREIGIDIHGVKGSGPGGRISMEDVKAHAKQRNRERDGGHRPATPAEPLPDFSQWGKVERRPMSMIRRKTAAHLGHAWSTIPHVTHFDQADISGLEAFQKTHAAAVEAAGGKLTVTAIVLKIVATALKVFPRFNTAVDVPNNEIIYKKYVHIGVAVDTDRGLLVPVIRDADKKSIQTLGIELTQLAERARAKKLTIEEMQGGNFTVSNLGGIGGTAFTPIIHWPEVAILGVSRKQTAAVLVKNRFEPRPMLPLSLSYDHRIIDGADAARFVAWIVQAIEQPLLLSLKG